MRAGHPALLERHLDRLVDGAKAIMLDVGHSGDITACIRAYTADVDEALMLDPQGFVATCNSTHCFVVVGPEDAPEVMTSDGRYCLAGITRANVLEICRANGIPARETMFSLTDVDAAREAFVTGTFAGRRGVPPDLRGGARPAGASLSSRGKDPGAAAGEAERPAAAHGSEVAPAIKALTDLGSSELV